ncbi:MAG TPA: PLP-dependent aminotransferase family protein [Myxococcota bacterium]|nr:PLP-dependent aminotransferase family protein [Myxococcota bacterium]
MRRKGFAEVMLWQLERGGATPLYRQIQQQLRDAVLSRALHPGARLPSTRELASRLGVARSCVIAAYSELLVEGVLSGRVGSGTYVSSDLPEPIEKAARRRSQRTGAARCFPVPARARIFESLAGDAQGETRAFQTGRSRVDGRTLEVWRRLTQRALRELEPRHLVYTDSRGLPELRRTLCEYLKAARAVRCEPEQILVTSGTQHALDLAIRVLLEPGDEVWVEDPGYPMAYAALLAAGLKPRPVPVDEHGLVVRAGLRAARRARAVYVTPSHQFPLGRVLSTARRLELLAFARETGAFVLEDDYDSEFRYSGRPLPSLQGLDDAQRVLYVGTFNKVLFPGLRVGYVVVPERLVRAFTAARHLMDRQPQSLLQLVLAEFMEQGHFAAHVRRMRLQYRDQRDALVSELVPRTGEPVRVEAPEQGMTLVAELPRGTRDEAVAAAALRAGVIARPLSGFYRKSEPRPGLLLGFTGHPRAEIATAVATLSRVIAEEIAAPRVRRTAGQG